MSKGTAILVLVLALICGLVASVAVLKIIQQNQKEKSVPVSATVAVMVAKTTISPGITITAEMVGVRNYPPEFAPVGVFNSQSDVLGRVVRSSIYSGEPIVEGRLQQSGSLGGLPALIPPGFRAFTLRVDETSNLGGFIRPGHIVDIVTTFDSTGGNKETISKVILQNVKVIASGQEVENAGSGTDEKDRQVKVIPTVTVIVTLEQAERLSLASNTGTIRLVLRNNTDKGEEFTTGVTLSSIIPQSLRDPMPPPQEVAMAPPQPEATPTPAMVTVELIRGKDKTDVSFVK